LKPIAAERECAIDTVAVTRVLDPYLSLRALAAYSNLSVRKLRDALQDALHPLSHYRVGGKILVRVSDFDAWIHVYRRRGLPDIDRIVDETMREFREEHAKRSTVRSGPER
jgi:hypothetical protein